MLLWCTYYLEPMTHTNNTELKIRQSINTKCVCEICFEIGCKILATAVEEIHQLLFDCEKPQYIDGEFSSMLNLNQTYVIMWLTLH